MYGLHGKMLAQDGQREALIGHLLEAARLLKDVVGCRLYVVSRATDDENGVWVTEVWDSAADHQASLQHPAVQTLIANARPIIAGMGDRIEFEPVGGLGLDVAG